MLRRVAIATLTVTVAASAVAAAPAGAGPLYFRAKPSGVGCAAFRLQERSATVRCDLPFLGSRAAFLHTRGEAAIRRVSSLLHLRHPIVLHRDATHSFGPFTCASRRRAVSCSVSGGHGFTVGPKFQLVF